MIVTTNQNKRVHCHQAEECELANLANKLLPVQPKPTKHSASRALSATHHCFLDAQETTLPKQLSLKQKSKLTCAHSCRWPNRNPKNQKVRDIQSGYTQDIETQCP